MRFEQIATPIIGGVGGIIIVAIVVLRWYKNTRYVSTLNKHSKPRDVRQRMGLVHLLDIDREETS